MGSAEWVSELVLLSGRVSAVEGRVLLIGRVSAAEWVSDAEWVSAAEWVGECC